MRKIYVLNRKASSKLHALSSVRSFITLEERGKLLKWFNCDYYFGYAAMSKIKNDNSLFDQALKLRTDKSTSTRNKLSHKVNNFAPGNHDFIAVVVF